MSKDLSHHVGAILSHRAHLTMSGDSLVVTTWKDATGTWWVEVRDAAEHPTMHRAAPT